MLLEKTGIWREGTNESFPQVSCGLVLIVGGVLDVVVKTHQCLHLLFVSSREGSLTTCGGSPRR